MALSFPDRLIGALAVLLGRGIVVPPPPPPAPPKPAPPEITLAEWFRGDDPPSLTGWRYTEPEATGARDDANVYD